MSILKNYIDNLKEQLDLLPIDVIESWGNNFLQLWKSNKQLFICGNGGSAGNAIHLANDYLYGISPTNPPQCVSLHSLQIHRSLPAGNDVGYEHIFSEQLKTLGQPDDHSASFPAVATLQMLLMLLKQQKIGMKSYAILGFNGGKCKELADHCIHIELNDMQIAEDLQCIIGHMIMQWLKNNQSISFSELVIL